MSGSWGPAAAWHAECVGGRRCTSRLQRRLEPPATSRCQSAERLPTVHCRRLPWLSIIYMGCGVTNGGLIMEVIALQVWAAAGRWMLHALQHPAPLMQCVRLLSNPAAAALLAWHGAAAVAQPAMRYQPSHAPLTLALPPLITRAALCTTIAAGCVLHRGRHHLHAGAGVWRRAGLLPAGRAVSASSDRGGCNGSGTAAACCTADQHRWSLVCCALLSSLRGLDAGLLAVHLLCC